VGDLAPHEPGVIATKCCIHCDEYDPATNCAHCFKPKVDPRFPALGRQVCPINSPCGLHIVGTERHEARRIDDQLCGRSGRQGDPGSSRFFLSLEDDLIRLFIGQRMTSVLSMLGFKSGMPIEDRRLTKAIKRAQKHVEERNFGVRKHLLEYDEVMDFQRREFYGLRQRVLEGKALSKLIWEMIDEAVEDALDRYLSDDYPRICAAEWCRSALDVSIEPNKLDVDDYQVLQHSIRDAAGDEARQTIQRGLGEYVDPSMEPDEWDIRGLAKWAGRFGSTMSQNQLRRMDPAEVEQHLLESAEQRVAEADLAAVRQFVDPTFGKARLVEWLRIKFGVELPIEEIVDAENDEVGRIVSEKIRNLYRQREYSYPAQETLQRALSEGPLENAYVAESIVQWANRKYNLGWTVEQVQSRPVQDIERDLIECTKDCLVNGRLEGEVERALSQHTGEQLVEWARTRFGRLVDEESLGGDDPRAELLRAGRELVRFELTRLERYVLLRTLDAAWKDHMYEMDLLRHGIGLRGYAERDPRIEYKREGTRMFHEMMERTRGRVTDDIFKVQLVASAAAQSSYNVSRLSHADSTGAGFNAAQADYQAAMAQQGEGAKPQTIRRQQPKVGRNAPCPCGSGKKYKNCCGKAR
jgi:preprotein translocase subunit SecA